MLINEVELAFFRIGLSQVKVGLFGFIAAWKKLPDLQNLIETPKHVYLLNIVQCWNQAHSID